MCRHLILLFIIVFTSYGQNTGVPGKDFFPYISFWDFAVYPGHPTQNSICDTTDYKSNMLQVHYYYPKLKELGLTNIVSDFRRIDGLGIGSHYDSIKFLDMDFGWAGNGVGRFNPGRYVKATGNNPDKFSHQIGGDWDMTWNPAKKILDLEHQQNPPAGRWKPLNSRLEVLL